LSRKGPKAALFGDAGIGSFVHNAYQPLGRLTPKGLAAPFTGRGTSGPSGP
jgi:hypothetical protein